MCHYYQTITPSLDDHPVHELFLNLFSRNYQSICNIKCKSLLNDLHNVLKIKIQINMPRGSYPGEEVKRLCKRCVARYCLIICKFLYFFVVSRPSEDFTRGSSSTDSTQ